MGSGRHGVLVEQRVKNSDTLRMKWEQHRYSQSTLGKQKSIAFLRIKSHIKRGSATSQEIVQCPSYWKYISVVFVTVNLRAVLLIKQHTDWTEAYQGLTRNYKQYSKRLTICNLMDKWVLDIDKICDCWPKKCYPHDLLKGKMIRSIQGQYLNFVAWDTFLN